MYKCLSMPISVTWEITERCNLMCIHCLSAKENSSGELDFDQAKAVIDELSQGMVFQINFGGGEPFLREDFLEILEYANKKGIVTCVSTNGTLFHNINLERLGRLKLLFLQVSLDGLKAETNDHIRGKGSFDRTMEGLRILKEYGFKKVRINTVVMKGNIDEIEEIYKFSKRMGFGLRLTRFRPEGRGKEIWTQYSLGKKELLKINEFLLTHKDVKTGDSFFPLTVGKTGGLNFCGAARMTCSISPQGEVYPCAFLKDKPFFAGNILDQPLKILWKESKVFERLRKIEKKECEGCLFFNKCHGGCLSVSYFVYNSLERRDPECIISLMQGVNHEDPI